MNATNRLIYVFKTVSPDKTQSGTKYTNLPKGTEICVCIRDKLPSSSLFREVELVWQ